jgi:hypothetical protein
MRIFDYECEDLNELKLNNEMCAFFCFKNEKDPEGLFENEKIQKI